MVCMPISVFALGGNALLSKGQKPSFQNMLKNIKRSVEQFSPVFASGEKVVITHGNGPQVGEEILRSEYAEQEVPRLPFYVSNAVTQVQIGMALEMEIRDMLERIGSDRQVVNLVTHVLVNQSREGEQMKPVGPYYTKAQLSKELKKEKFTYIKEKGMYRKTVNSPTPRSIVESSTIKDLVEDSVITIACGGGGIPVVRGKNGYGWINGVVDKDHASQVLANSISAERLYLLTDVDYAYLQYPKKPIIRSNSEQMFKLLPSLEEGTMRPKVEACAEFIRNGGSEARIGNLFKLGDVLADGGTVIRHYVKEGIVTL